MAPKLEQVTMSLWDQTARKKIFERNRKHLQGQRRARFSQRRTTTFVTEDDSLRLKQLQDRFEVKQAKQLEKQNSAAELIKEREDTLVKDTIEISKQYIHNRLYQEKIGVPDVRRLSICSSFTSEVLRLGYQFEETYPSLFAEITKQLKVSFLDRRVLAQLMRDFSKALFRDGKITWYRIIVLFTYGASLAIDLQSRGQTEMIQQIPNLLASEAFNTEVGFINRPE